MYLVHWILLFGIFVFANYKTLGLYFWHDDFSSFYGPIVGQCIHGWPYYAFCTVFDWLVKVLGYTPFPYFLLGNILAFSSIILFYLFTQKLFNNKQAALGISGLLASSYIASGVFLEAWDPIASYVTLSGLFASLILCLGAISKKFHLKMFVLSVIVLLFSISIFSFRAATNFVPFIATILLFANKKILLRNKLVLSAGVLVLSILVFSVLPLKILRQPLDSFWPSLNFFSLIINSNKQIFFFQTISSFVFPDFLHSLIPQNLLKNFQVFLGFLISAAFLIYTFSRRKEEFIKIRIFAIIWILALFFPYWLRNNFYLNSTHRYILWLLPGILIVWGTFFKKRAWLLFTFLVIILNIFQVNKFYKVHLEKSKQRQSFYKELHAYLPNLPEGSVLFFAYPPNIKPTVDDFFRVGFTPPESALGTEFAVDYHTIKLITDSDIFRRYLNENPSKETSLYTFFYDGQTLVNTTSETKSLIRKTLPLNSNANDPGFPIPGYLNLTMAASLEDIPLPFKQDCPACSEISNPSYYLEYLSATQKIKSLTQIEARDSFEETTDESMLDSNKGTYWLFNRQFWHQGQRPQINLVLEKPYELAGLILFNNYQAGVPNEIEILIDGKVVPTNLESFIGGIKVVFEKQMAQKITVGIVKTQGNDSPFINEIDLIPNGFGEVNPLLADEIRNFPLRKIENGTQLSQLKEYLKGGTQACLRWTNEYGKGEEKFLFFIDNKFHNYQIPIPALRGKKTSFEVSCLNLPIKINRASINASF